MMTYVQALENAISSIENLDNMTETVERLEALKASIQNRKSSTNSKKSAETESRMDAVVEALSNCESPVTVTDLIASASNEVNTYTNQRVSALLRKLVENKRVEKTLVGKKALFKVMA